MATTDSSSESRKETPGAPNTPSPPYPGPPTTPVDEAQRASTAGRARKKSTSKKTSRKKTTTRSRRSSKATTVEPGKPTQPTSTSSSDEYPGPPTDVGVTGVKSLLKIFGGVVHYGVCTFQGLDPDEFPELGKMTPDELEHIAEPTVNLAQRSPLVMAVLKRIDLLRLGLGTAHYGFRTATEINSATDNYDKELAAHGTGDGTNASTGSDRAGHFRPEVREIPVVGDVGAVDALRPTPPDDSEGV